MPFKEIFRVGSTNPKLSQKNFWVAQIFLVQTIQVKLSDFFFHTVFFQCFPFFLVEHELIHWKVHKSWNTLATHYKNDFKNLRKADGAALFDYFFIFHKQGINFRRRENATHEVFLLLGTVEIVQDVVSKFQAILVTSDTSLPSNAIDCCPPQVKIAADNCYWYF